VHAWPLQQNDLVCTFRWILISIVEVREDNVKCKKLAFFLEYIRTGGKYVKSLMYQIFSIRNLYNNNSFTFIVDLKCHQKFHRKKKIYTHDIY